MKVSDVIASFLKERVDYVFALQGGAAVHLLDSCERVGPKPIYCHHEQASAFAATAYARAHGYGVCVVTTGPAATNALTPCLGAWQDSIPCMFISGQQRVSLTSYGTKHRQVGSQEAPILDIVRPIVKGTYLMTDASKVREMLNTAWMMSMFGRPGPVWIDVPVDVQWAQC